MNLNRHDLVMSNEMSDVNRGGGGANSSSDEGGGGGSSNINNVLHLSHLTSSISNLSTSKEISICLFNLFICYRRGKRKIIIKTAVNFVFQSTCYFFLL